MNNESFLIEELDLDIAKDVCKFIDDSELRNRAVANVTAANLAKKYFQDIEIDVESGLHNIFQVLEDTEISDIYIKDNYIDVRLYFDDNNIFVPKSHFDNNMLPVAYMFIKIENDLSNGLVVGFMVPSSIDTTNEHEGYYKVNESDFISFYDVETHLVNKQDEALPENFEAQMYEYLDGNLSAKNEFYQLLINSREGRLKLINAAKVKTIFDFISIPQNDITEEKLDIIEEPSLEINENFEQIEDTLESFGDVDELSLDTEDDFVLNEVDSQELDITDAETIEMDLSDDPQEEITEYAEIDSDLTIENNLSDTVDIDNIQEPVLDTDISNLESDFSEQMENIEEEEEEENIESLYSQEVETIDTPDESETQEFKYSTTTTPSIDSFELQDEKEQQDDLSADLEKALDADANLSVNDINQEAEEQENENSKEINTLFGEEEVETIEPIKPSKPKNVFLPILGTIVIASGVAYYGYNKFIASPQASNNTETVQNAVQLENETLNKQDVEAMPVETVENINLNLKTDEGNAVSIPAIEKNLDASIAVSNLSIDFLVPTAYKSNKTAARYLGKMGKIIQLNLKTELLLLTKQPITNRIEVELEYNKNTQKFDVKGILASSGEKSSDDLIVQTVKNALNINLNINMNTFNNISGNPVLVIKL